MHTDLFYTNCLFSTETLQNEVLFETHTISIPIHIWNGDDVLQQLGPSENNVWSRRLFEGMQMPLPPRQAISYSDCMYIFLILFCF